MFIFSLKIQSFIDICRTVGKITCRPTRRGLSQILHIFCKKFWTLPISIYCNFLGNGVYQNCSVIFKTHIIVSCYLDHISTIRYLQIRLSLHLGSLEDIPVFMISSVLCALTCTINETPIGIILANECAYWIVHMSV